MYPGEIKILKECIESIELCRARIENISDGKILELDSVENYLNQGSIELKDFIEQQKED